MSIHILDDDSLLNVFYLYRPARDDDERGAGCQHERWWYKLAHVCQRWRNLIFGSASYLRLCLVCSHGTPVADMLAVSPPLPLVIDYIYDTITEDVDEIILALEQRDRVLRIRLLMPVSNLHTLVMAMDGEYARLEYLVMWPLTQGESVALMLPETLQAPHLRHLLLKGSAFPIGSRFFTTVVSLVTLTLDVGDAFSYFQPNFLLQWLSLLPRLEKLLIYISHLVPNSDVESQFMHTPIMTHVPLPNLRWFEFQGPSADMEVVVRRITAPRLKRLRIVLFEQPRFSVSSFLPFMNTSEDLRFDSVEFKFSNNRVIVEVYLREDADVYALSMTVFCWQLSWQVSSMAQIFNSPGQISSTVEHLTLGFEGLPNEANRTEWRKLLRSFGNVKTLRVNDGLVKELSRCLPPDDGEYPVDLLPELQELTYSWSGDTCDAFTSFIDVRQNAGHPVTLIRHG